METHAIRITRRVRKGLMVTVVQIRAKSYMDARLIGDQLENLRDEAFEYVLRHQLT